jgi:hypothetical protein
MKTNKLYLSLLSVCLLTIVSCKKEDEKTTAEKIQAKWQVESTYYNDHIAGEDDSETLPGNASDYFDFRADGKLYYNLDGDADTLNYALQNDTKIILQGSGFGTVFDIQNLTDNTLELYTKENDPDNTDDFSELAINLKK